MRPSKSEALRSIARRRTRPRATADGSLGAVLAGVQDQDHTRVVMDLLQELGFFPAEPNPSEVEAMHGPDAIGEADGALRPLARHKQQVAIIAPPR